MESDKIDVKKPVIDLKTALQRLVDGVDKLEQRVSDLELIRWNSTQSKKSK